MWFKAFFEANLSPSRITALIYWKPCRKKVLKFFLSWNKQSERTSYIEFTDCIWHINEISRVAKLLIFNVKIILTRLLPYLIMIKLKIYASWGKVCTVIFKIAILRSLFFRCKSPSCHLILALLNAAAASFTIVK